MELRRNEMEFQAGAAFAILTSLPALMIGAAIALGVYMHYLINLQMVSTTGVLFGSLSVIVFTLIGCSWVEDLRGTYRARFPT